MRRWFACNGGGRRGSDAAGALLWHSCARDPPPPAAHSRSVMPTFFLRLFDFLLLSAAAALFGACLTSVLKTDAYGWMIPDAPFLYGPFEFYVDSALAGLAGLLSLALAERLARVRRSAAWRAAATLAAVLVALYLAPPDPQVFGNTWAPGEATRELFVAQWRMVLPIAFAALALRLGLRSMLARSGT